MPKYIPKETVNEIIEAMDIYDVVSGYVNTLKKRGANYWALSPFTSEKSPSFAVNPAKGIYKCFSTGKGGNAISFLMELEGYNFVEALTELANKYNITIPDVEEPQDNELLKESMHIVLNRANTFFISNRNKVFSDFLTSRCIDNETANKFGLGIANDEWQGFTDTLHDMDIAVQANVVMKSEKNGKYYDVFRNRIMFPIHSSIGKIIGFGGRYLGSREDAKYINTGATLLYDKSRVWYGLHLAKTAIRMQGFAFVCEGYMDVIAMHQNKLENTISTSGTALTPEQVRLLRRLTKKVVLIFDGDSAGIKASMRSIDILIAEGMEVFIMTLPDGHDPDSYLNQLGKDNFLKEVEKKQGFVDYKIAMGINAEMTPTQVRDTINSIAKSVSLIEDPVEAQLYTRVLSQKTNVDYDLVYAIVRENSEANARVKSKLDLSFIDIALSNTDAPLINEIEITEKVILEMYLRYGSITIEANGEYLSISDYIEQNLCGMTFFNSLYQTIREDYLSTGNGVEAYVNHTDDRIKMIATELNSLQAKVAMMLKGLDSFEMQEAWFDIVSNLVNMYANEWHSKMIGIVISRVNNTQSKDEYIKTVSPLLERINVHSIEEYVL